MGMRRVRINMPLPKLSSLSGVRGVKKKRTANEGGGKSEEQTPAARPLPVNVTSPEPRGQKPGEKENSPPQGVLSEAEGIAGAMDGLGLEPFVPSKSLVTRWAAMFAQRAVPQERVRKWEHDFLKRTSLQGAEEEQAEAADRKSVV